CKYYGCFSLTSIDIPDGVTSIGRMAFEGCNSLLEVTSNASIPPTLGSSCFQYIYSSTLIVPAGTYAAYMASDWASYFTTIEEK
ncbi:MAG: leucine-rich repeat protein, partial [Bacteroides sp.]|nr:leucine-rich repeat protein [Bacteroides sp.]